MLYRIITEDKGTSYTQDIVDLVTSRFRSFTLYYGLGYWKGKPESNLTIEIYMDLNPGEEKEILEKVQFLAFDIRDLLNQESVLVQALPCEGVFV